MLIGWRVSSRQFDWWTTLHPPTTPLQSLHCGRRPAQYRRCDTRGNTDSCTVLCGPLAPFLQSSFSFALSVATVTEARQQRICQSFGVSQHLLYAARVRCTYKVAIQHTNSQLTTMLSPPPSLRPHLWSSSLTRSSVAAGIKDRLIERMTSPHPLSHKTGYFSAVTADSVIT